MRFVLNIAVCWLLAYGIAKPLMLYLLSGAQEKVRDNVAMLAGMVLFTGFNYLGQRLFAFRAPKTDAAQDTDPAESAEAADEEKP